MQLIEEVKLIKERYGHPKIRWDVPMHMRGFIKNEW